MNRIASYEDLLHEAQTLSNQISYENFVQSVLLLGRLSISTYETKLDIHQIQTLLIIAGTRLTHVESERIRMDFECKIRELERKLG